MKALAIVECNGTDSSTAASSKFWDVVSTPGHKVEYSSTLLAACEAFVVGWQRGAREALALYGDTP